MGKLELCALLAQLGEQARSLGLKAFGRRLAHIGQLNDVPAEIGLNQIGNGPALQRKHRLLERRHHGTAGKEAEVAAALGRARVLRIGAGQFGKTGRVLLQLLQQRLRLRPHLGLLFGRGGGVEREQDVAGAALFFLRNLGQVLLVQRTHILLADFDALRQRGLVQHQVFDIDLLGRLEAVRVLLVEGLQIGVADRDTGPERRRGKQCHLNFARLEIGLQGQIRHLNGLECGRSQAVEHLAAHHVGAQGFLELLHRQALSAQQLLVALHIEGAIGAAQLGNDWVLGQRGGELLIGDQKMPFGGGQGQQALVDHALQGRKARGFGVELLALQVSVGLQQALHVVAVLLVPLLAGDFHIAHARHRIG